MQLLLMFYLNALIPLLALALMVFGARLFSRAQPFAIALFWRCFAAIFYVFVLLVIDEMFEIHYNFAVDYSTHFAIVITLSWCLHNMNERWFYPLLVLALLYALIQMLVGLHTIFDAIVTATFVLPVLFWLRSRAKRRGNL